MNNNSGYINPFNGWVDINSTYTSASYTGSALTTAVFGDTTSTTTNCIGDYTGTSGTTSYCWHCNCWHWPSYFYTAPAYTRLSDEDVDRIASKLAEKLKPKRTRAGRRKRV